MTGLPWRPPELRLPFDTQITHRQADVLTGVCMGLTNLQIAKRLQLTEDTVKSHVKALLRAARAANRAHLAALVCSRQVRLTVCRYRAADAA